jgi:hypothetical protein
MLRQRRRHRRFSRGKAWRSLGRLAAGAIRLANHRRFDAALQMAQIPCMMIAGDGMRWRHHFAIKPGFGRICRFSRDFMARIDGPR